ncbi:MAG: hypothetical protein HY425_01540 [Candidatus Levybacteria bacterium]|nr:hypothetical protein [Candidatus Levybacteria bacterium]
MWNNLSRFKRILIILAIVASLVVIPLTIFQALTQQSLQQKASGNNLILGAYPNTGVYNVNDSVSVSISLTNTQKDISGVDFIINYDPNILQFNNFIVTNPGFTTIINPNSSKTLGKIHYAGVNTSTKSSENTSQFDIGTVSFISIKTTGNDNVTGLSFANPIITAGNYNSPLPITQSVWQYTIKSSSLPFSQSPPTGNVSTPTTLTPTTVIFAPTLIPTATSISLPTPTSVPAASSSDADYNTCVAICNRNAAADPETFSGYACVQDCNTQYGR